MGLGKSIQAPTKRTVFSWLTSRACLISHSSVEVMSTCKLNRMKVNRYIRYLQFQWICPQLKLAYTQTSWIHKIKDTNIYTQPRVLDFRDIFVVHLGYWNRKVILKMLHPNSTNIFGYWFGQYLHIVDLEVDFTYSVEPQCCGTDAFIKAD